MTRGRPFQPGNKLGRGRPKGTPNKKVKQAQKIFEDHSPAIMALAINTARADPQMLRMLASHIVPRAKDLPTKIGRVPLSTFDDLDRASEFVLNKATAGKIPLSEAREVTAMIGHRRQVLESQNLERRLSALEDLKKT